MQTASSQAMLPLNADGIAIAHGTPIVMQEQISTTTSSALHHQWLAGFTDIGRGSCGPGARGGGHGTIVTVLLVLVLVLSPMLVGGLVEAAAHERGGGRDGARAG